ncbi:DEKNAAC101355 [Brettanomyces naardenensis]|uniref:low-specificity L-threonine aldolase n=1 Tax=Brettanomyces naardenensis TaxID=13370 RepID=A0A448YHS1_BRENA|nr:DEKNAAC101355 [Brettanomyces naardenensis]
MTYETYNEFRSDTFTVPTKEMIQSVLDCSVGDSVYKEDKDTLELESYVAKLAGKEAGLFCCSGTMSNQIALRAHLYQPPHRILCDYRAHVYSHEAGGLATLSQAMVTPVIPANGLYLTLDDIIANFIPDDGNIHMAPTRVVSLENTLSGLVYPLDELKRISHWCHDNGVKLHCDGARLWNAAAEGDVSVGEICKYFDSVSLCLSKTLGAPIGSLLVGDRAFIEKANHFKKQNGGGLRQQGMLARMALIAVKDNFPKLKETHKWAKEFGKWCEENGIALEVPVQTNFVFIDFSKVKLNPSVWDESCKKYNVRTMGNRISFHYQNTPDAIESLKKALLEAYKDSLVNPYVRKGAPSLYRASSSGSDSTMVEKEKQAAKAI